LSGGDLFLVALDDTGTIPLKKASQDRALVIVICRTLEQETCQFADSRADDNDASDREKPGRTGLFPGAPCAI
jgi:hypothetical protein